MELLTDIFLFIIGWILKIGILGGLFFWIVNLLSVPFTKNGKGIFHQD